MCGFMRSRFGDLNGSLSKRSINKFTLPVKRVFWNNYE